jgi:hypothetical protein
MDRRTYQKPATILSAADKTQLCSTLKSIDISVPLRTEGRTTEHAETWTICRLLATMAELNLVHYPLTVQHRDRPDFLVQFGETPIGIEVTEAISEQYAAYSALAEREFPDVLIEPGHFRWGRPKLTTNEMRALLRQDQLSASPWVGDRAEREWALYIQSIVESKLAKLAKPGFSHFSENWLSIYDNLPLCHIDLEKAVSFLQPALVTLWPRALTFSAIYVEHGPVIVKLTRFETRHLLLYDLW